MTIAVEVVEAVAIGIMRHGELLILKEGIVILAASWRIVGHSWTCNKVIERQSNFHLADEYRSSDKTLKLSRLSTRRNLTRQAQVRLEQAFDQVVPCVSDGETSGETVRKKMEASRGSGGPVKLG